MDVAIVCMTRCSNDLLKWVEYHLEIGFSRIYLRLEGDKILTTMKELHKYREVKVLEQEVSPMGAQMARQEFLVEEAIKTAREESIDYLLHIDDDELFHVSAAGLQGMLREMEDVKNGEWDYLVFDNVEAVYPHTKDTQSKTCFEKTSWFHDCYDSPCRGYGNGKSMTKIDIEDPAPLGVHSFRGRSVRVPKKMAMILHYESCDFDLWRLKFQTLKEPTNFPFYEQSKEAVQNHANCNAHPAQCDAQLYDFYKRRTGLDSTDTRFQI